MADFSSRSAIVAWILLALFVPLGHARADVDPPGGTARNILVILLDDVGPDQLQCFDEFSPGAGLAPGSNLYTSPYPYARTPNMTLLAKEGVRFTRAFTSAVCSPSRAQLMTGRYPFRNQIGNIVLATGGTKEIGHRSPSDLPSRIPQLPDSEFLLPEMMEGSPSGYRMGLFGKWHLSGQRCWAESKGVMPAGMPSEFPYSLSDIDGGEHPLTASSGWPEFKGLVGNIISNPTPVTDGCTLDIRGTYFEWFYVHSLDGASPLYDECQVVTLDDNGNQFAPKRCPPLTSPTFPVPSNTNTVREFSTRFITTVLREDVEEFALRNEPDPWFAVWTPQACHGPFIWPPQDLHDYGPDPLAADGGRFAWLRFRAILQSFDTELGHLRAALDQGPGETIWDNTMVILLGDNGTDENAMRNADSDPSEGGVPGVLDPYVAPSVYYTDPQMMIKAEPKQPTRFKGSPYVSGTSMICVVSGPDIVSPGRTYGGLVDMVDIYATIQEIAQVPPASQPVTNPVDGVSLCPVLSSVSGTTSRTESLAMIYSPNGPFDINEPHGVVGTGGDTRVYRIGYTLKVTGQPGNLDGMYHLVVQRWVERKTQGVDWDVVIREPIEFYKLCNAAGDNVDTQECSNLNDPANPDFAAHTGIFTLLCQGLDGIIDTAPIDFCTNPISPP